MRFHLPRLHERNGLLRHTGVHLLRQQAIFHRRRNAKLASRNVRSTLRSVVVHERTQFRPERLTNRITKASTTSVLRVKAGENNQCGGCDDHREQHAPSAP